MKIALGVDHAAYDYKAAMRRVIESQGHTVVDCGTDSPQSVDYPTIVAAVAGAVLGGGADLGLFLCGTGIGGSIAANKIPGIRAALCHETFTARMCREHNNANVLCIGARVVGLTLAEEIVTTFLTTAWPNDERHARRLRMVNDLETRLTPPPGCTIP